MPRDYKREYKVRSQKDRNDRSYRRRARRLLQNLGEKMLTIKIKTQEIILEKI